MVQGETDKTASDIQARSFKARTLDETGKTCKAKGRNPKLDNARILRGICFIDPEDKEFKETIKNAHKKLETPMAPAMPCKTSKQSKHGETRSKTSDFNSKFACILEASESTRLCMEESLPKYHEDHVAGKGNNSRQHYNLVHKFIPMPQAMKIPAAKAAVDKECEKLEKIPAWYLTKVRSKSEVIDEARTKGIKVHRLTDGHMSLERMPNWRQSTKNTKVELYSEVTLGKKIQDHTQCQISRDDQRSE